MTRARDVANLIGSGNYSSTTFTATAGQTVFSIAHTQNFVQVFMNGLLLDLTVDYTSNGSAVTLTSGAAAGDEIEVVKYNTFSVGDALNQAAADTRYVNASGDTMTGNLGIGTTSPNGALHVKGISDHGKIVVEHGGTSGSTNHNFISFHNHAGNTVAEIQSEENATNSSALLFKTGGTTTNMTISHNGYVTMPNQPNISITLSTNNAVNYTSPTAMFATSSVTTDTQVGITHNTSNGRFTVPVAGRYYFSFFTIVNGALSSYINFNHNGTRRADAYDSDDGGWRTMSCCGIYNMAANDYIEPYNAGVNKGTGDVHGLHHMRFTMHLIG